MKKMLKVWLALALCLGMWRGVGAAAQTAGASQDGAKWMNDLAARHEELIKRNGPGTDAALRARLLEMGEKDQSARGMVQGHPVDKDKMVVAANLAQIDERLTAELKEIVARHGWPTIAMVGYKASTDAMLILTHSQDHAWQRAMTPKLEALAAKGKIDGSGLALVVDKELVSEGKKQRYGTQFKEVNGKMEMFAVEDPEGLDARRASVFLMPMEAYEQLLTQMYHLQVSDQVASAK
jgi:hypothetical protein